MNIGEKELKDIREKSKKQDLENILTKDYADSEIYIIGGRDRFSYENYTKDAFFDKDKAYTEMSKIKPNGSPGICDTYRIHKETPISLKNSRYFDDIDRMMIYEKLEKNYVNKK